MSESRTSNADWIARVERARDVWEQLVVEASDLGMDRPGATGEWTFKEVATHLNAWRTLTIARLEAAAGDKNAPEMPWPNGMSEETDDGTREINQWFTARDQDRSLADILAETRYQFEKILATIEAIPDAELEARYPWLEGYPISAVIEGMLEHLHVDHEPEIRAWLSARSSST